MLGLSPWGLWAGQKISQKTKIKVQARFYSLFKKEKRLIATDCFGGQ
jgi:hypothetical protein